MTNLNYHHLHYFWAVAKEGNLTRAATRLHVSQSALSTQIQKLEAQVGQPLFARTGRTMSLTEAGQVALGYAETIFSTGDELISVLQNQQHPERQSLRVGAVATLSRNFQENLLQPLLPRDDVQLSLQSGRLRELLQGLRVHSLDLVLSNQRVQATAEDPWRCRRIARQPVSLVGKPRRSRKKFRFPEDMADQPLVLPSHASDIRPGFDVLCSRLGVRYQLQAEVDDMALLRLLARDSGAMAVVPTVVVRDELRDRKLQQYCVLPDLFENFYAITVPRQFEPPLLKDLLRRGADEVLGE